MAVSKAETFSNIRNLFPAAHTHYSQQTFTLREHVQRAMQHYFSQLDGGPVANIYNMVLTEVEKPLFHSVMRHTHGNQSKAAILLGISRGTLRKKLKLYDLEDVR